MNHKNIKIILTIATATILFFIQNGTTAAATLDSEEAAFVTLLNDYRKSLGRIELKITQPLVDGSDYFADYFANNADDDDANIHKDRTYGGPEERGQHFGFYFLTENMGWGYGTAQEVFDAWKASSGHRQNMINEGARTIGIARAYKAGGTKNGASVEWYWVMDLSDEGVERLSGNNLKSSEMYSSNFRKMTVKIKKWSKTKGKYIKAKYAEVKVYDQNTGQLLDHDIADSSGNCSLFVMMNGSSRKVKIKAAKLINRSTSKFTVKGKLSSKKLVKSKNTTLKKNIKFEIRFR